jgi:hypothetical protein
MTTLGRLRLCDDASHATLLDRLGLQVLACLSASHFNLTEMRCACS